MAARKNRSGDLVQDTKESTLLQCVEICAKKRVAFLEMRKYRTHGMTGDELEAAAKGCQECCAAIRAVLEEVCEKGKRGR